MKKNLELLFLRNLILTLSVLGFVACSSGSGTPEFQPPVTNASPGGIWVGIDSTGGNLVAFVTESGRFHVVDEFLSQGTGVLSVSNGNDVASNFPLVPLLGLTFPDGTTLADCALSGTIVERQTLDISVDCTTTAGAQDQITADLTYDPVYERDSSLQTIAGMYVDSLGIVTDINENGMAFGQDPASGCVTNGLVSIIDGAFSLYDAEFEFSNCLGALAFLNGTTFVGLAELDNSVVPETLFIASTGDVGFLVASFFTVSERL